MEGQGKTAAPIAKKVIKKVLERDQLRQRVNSLIEKVFNVSRKIYSIIFIF